MIELYHGNALDVIHSLTPRSFDAMITDPPYSTGATLGDVSKPTASKYTATKNACPFPEFDGDHMDQRCWTGFMTDVFAAARMLCKPESVCAIFICWRQIPSITDAMQRAGWTWRGVAVWDKGGSARPQKGRFRQQAEFIVWGSYGKMPFDRPAPVLPGVFNVPNVVGDERLHQTQKPLDLMRQLVRICSAGGRIIDPFAGSGTTLTAARNEGYDATGIEINEDIANAAAARLGVALTHTEGGIPMPKL